MPIGQNAQLSHHFGRYVLGDTQKYPDKSMTSINRQRLIRAIAMKVSEGSGSFYPQVDTIKVKTMHASKGLEFPVVALMGVGQMPAAGEDERDEARLFYVGATRATQRLVIGVMGTGSFANQLIT